jgi:hypothetical protein
MKSIHYFLKALSLSLILLPTFALAQGAEGKFSLMVQKLQNRGQNDAGYTVGMRNSSYFTDSKFYYGLEANMGTSTGKRFESDHIAYGGLAFGTDGVLQGAVTYDLSTLLGYGFGSVTNGISAHSAVIQPTLSLGLLLHSGYRASFAAGYMYMPGAQGFSTFTFGIRIEHKARYSPDNSN